MNVHVTVSLDPEKLARFDLWWKAEGFKSRSDAIQFLMVSVKASAKGEEPWAQ